MAAWGQEVPAAAAEEGSEVDRALRSESDETSPTRRALLQLMGWPPQVSPWCVCDWIPSAPYTCMRPHEPGSRMCSRRGWL